MTRAKWRRCTDCGDVLDLSVKPSTDQHTAKHPNGGFSLEALDDEETGQGRPPSGAKVLLDLFAKSQATLIKDQYGEPFAKFPDRRVLPLSGSGVGQALTHLYMQYTEGNPPPKNAGGEVIEVLRARAANEAASEPVYLRFGPLPGGDGVAIDLGDVENNAIVITGEGWKVRRHPINFRRTPAMEELPRPDRDGLRATGQDLVGAMKALLNVRDEDTARLVVAFLVSLLKPEGSFLGIAMTGPAGAAKTFAAKVLRRLIDPVNRDGGGGVRTLPRDPDSFAAIAIANAIPVFDNLSGASPEQSDMLALLMTGYSNEKRRLYTDDESFQRAAKRPVVLTGIDITDRSDLLSRLLVVELLPVESYTTEAKVWRGFDLLHPYVLGALCDAVVGAYRVLPTVREDGWKVRMADMVRFVTAAEPALGWDPGWTEKALAESQGESFATVLAQQTWYPALLSLLDAHGGSYEGLATSLLDELRERHATSQALQRGSKYPDPGDYPRATDVTWPKDATRLSQALKRHVSGLAQVGITYSSKRTKNGARLNFETTA